MSRAIRFSLTAVIWMVAAGLVTTAIAEPAPPSDPLTELPLTLEVKAPSLPASLVIPQKNAFSGFGCTGDNVSPSLTWSAGPEGTRSYLIMMYDPDAPTGVGFHHWWVANLPSNTNALAEGAGGPEGKLPRGAVQGRNDYSTTHYGGPCPPKGRTHRYEFYVWALSVDSLPVEPQTSPVVVRFLLRDKALAVGRLTAKHGR